MVEYCSLEDAWGNDYNKKKKKKKSKEISCNLSRKKKKKVDMDKVGGFNKKKYSYANYADSKSDYTRDFTNLKGHDSPKYRQKTKPVVINAGDEADQS